MHDLGEVGYSGGNYAKRIQGRRLLRGANPRGSLGKSPNPRDFYNVARASRCSAATLWCPPALLTHGEVFLAHGPPWRSSTARHGDFVKTSFIGPSSLGRARADARALALGVESAPAILFGMRASRRETFASRWPASRARGGDGAGWARRRAQERRSRRPTAS